MSSVTGIFSNNGRVIQDEEVVPLLYSFNIIQDHRGQAGAGVVTVNPKRIKEPFKDRGPARSSTPLRKLQQMSDHTTFAGLAHTCYGKDVFVRREDIHPLRVDSRNYEVYIVSDGVLVDKEQRREKLIDEGYSFFGSKTNGSVIGTLFSKNLDELGDEFEAGQRVIEETHSSGGFSSVLLVRRKRDGKTKIVAIRDKTANKPMCYGETNDTFFVASETYPLQHFGVSNIRRVRGGDVVVFSDNGIDVKDFGDVRLERPCFFEEIYFGGPEALVLDDLGPLFPELARRLGRDVKPEYRPSNFTVRNCLGLAWYDLWKDDMPRPDLISPIVESGKGVTVGMAAGYGVTAQEYMESLVKTLAYRTFQIPNAEERWLEVMLKIKLITDLLFGKRVLLGDDSIVKGGMSGVSIYEDIGERVFFPREKYGVVRQLKTTGGVRDIIIGISFAPMFCQCFYGFDVMDRYAAQGSVGKSLSEVNDDVARILDPEWGSDGRLKVRYNSLANVQGISGPNHCLACANGCYPIREDLIPSEIRERIEIINR